MLYFVGETSLFHPSFIHFIFSFTFKWLLYSLLWVKWGGWMKICGEVEGECLSWGESSFCVRVVFLQTWVANDFLICLSFIFFGGALVSYFTGLMKK